MQHPFSARGSIPSADDFHQLDEIYLRLSRARDFITQRQIVTNTGISGSPDSGKTTGPFQTFQYAAWLHDDPGLGLCAKPDSCSKMLKIAEATGQLHRVEVVSATSGHSWNPVTYAIEHSKGIAMVDEAMDALWNMVEILNRGEILKQGDAFFDQGGKQLIRAIMQVQWDRYRKIDMLRVLKCLQLLPQGFAALEDSQKYPILEDLDQALAAMQERGNHALEMAADYFRNSITNLHPKTLSSLRMTAEVRMSPVFADPIMKMCFMPGKPISPDDIVFGNKIVILDVPYSEFFGQSRALGAAWKRATQRCVMNRAGKLSGDERKLPAVGIWADECQCWLTDFDIEAAERGRSTKLYHVFAWQAWGSLVNGYGGGQVGESKAEALLANFGVRVMCRQICPKTRERDSKMIGTAEVWVPTHGTSNGGDDGQGGGGPRETYSVTLQPRPTLPEGAFLSLECDKGIVDAFVFKGGPLFRHNGQRVLRVEFAQEKLDSLAGALTEQRPRARPWIRPTEAFTFNWRSAMAPISALKAWANVWTDGRAFPKGPGGRHA